MPFAGGGDVMIGAVTMSTVYVFESRPATLVAATAKVKEPPVVGVPLIVPVVESSVSPFGSVPDVTEYEIGPVPDAVTVCE